MNSIKSGSTLLFTALLSLCAPLITRAATYYVATNGVDTNLGTQAAPFRTIQHGLDSATNGDLVQVAPGTYYEHAGCTNKGLTLQGAGPGQSIIDGGLNGVCLAFDSDARFTFPDVTVTGFTFQNGWNPNWAGGLVNGFSSVLNVSNCVFSGNMGQVGGGMYSVWGAPTVSHCTFFNNSAYLGSGLFNAGSPTIVSDCVFYGNQALAGGAMYNQQARPVVARCTFTNNSGNLGAGIYNLNSSPTVSGCVFGGNVAGDPHAANPGLGAAMYNEGQTITNCRPLIVNCTFFSNSVTGRGGAIYSKAAGLTLVNSTFTGNNRIAVVNDSNTIATIVNCIFWGNSNPTNGPTAILDDNTPSIATYSDVQGGWPGLGNLNADPLFVSVAAGNLHLQPSSPCINAGDSLAANLPAADFDSAPRIVGPAPDMGAYESTPGFWFVDRALGSDANAGTVTAPFQTVTAALNAAASGHSICIRQGNYGSDRPRITKSLRLLNWNNAGLARIGQP